MWYDLTGHLMLTTLCSPAPTRFQMVLFGVLLEPGVNAVKPDGHGSDGHSWWTAFHLHVTITASNFHLSRSARPDPMTGSHMTVQKGLQYQITNIHFIILLAYSLSISIEI